MIMCQTEYYVETSTVINTQPATLHNVAEACNITKSNTNTPSVFKICTNGVKSHSITFV